MTAKVKKVKEQNLAVFGESGSGKTVLLSSFYGASQEPSFRDESLYKVLADDTGQGNRLRQNYLRMRNQAEAPETNRFTATPYSFTLKLNDPGDGKAAKASPLTRCVSSGTTTLASGGPKTPAAPRRQRAGSIRSSDS
jgi:recombinational DNA repair ATPase RecF